MSALPPYPGQGGYNQWQEPYAIDMSAFLGDVVDIAWHAVDGNSQGLWYYWAIDDCTLGSKKIPLLQDQPYYDIYRQDNSGTGFAKINPAPVTDTAYIDTNLPAGLYKYYVQIVNPVCSEALTSDTITVDVVTSVPPGSLYKLITVYPNPAHDRIRVRSDMPLNRFTLTGIPGNIVFDSQLKEELSTWISLDGLKPGLYIMKLFTLNGCYTAKLSILQ